MTTYSTSLKLALIGDGQEVGTWGQTTNTNLGTLLEQAITGATSINMADSNVTLSSLNGTVDQARNQVLVLTGTNNAVRDVIPPVVKKTYIVVNNTTGGYAIRVIGASGTGVLVPNGTTSLIYCDGTSFIEAINSNTITGNSIISGNLAVGGATTLTGALTGNTAAFSGVVTAPTAANGTSTTQVATTAFVGSAISSQGLGTMATQNANAVAITGGNATVNTFRSTGTAYLSGSTAAVRGINFGADEIAWALPGPSSLAILNVSDSNGNNGGNYSVLIRGLGSNGTVGTNFSGFSVSANASTFGGTIANSSGVIGFPTYANPTSGIPLDGTPWQAPSNGYVTIAAWGQFRNGFRVYVGSDSSTPYLICVMGDDINNNTKGSSFSFPIRSGAWATLINNADPFFSPGQGFEFVTAYFWPVT